jgi:hypothetical protein
MYKLKKLIEDYGTGKKDVNLWGIPVTYKKTEWGQGNTSFPQLAKKDVVKMVQDNYPEYKECWDKDLAKKLKEHGVTGIEVGQHFDQFFPRLIYSGLK